jgi:hypothetical protein
MLLLTREDIRRALSMAGAMEAVASAFAQLADGQAQVPLRSRVEAPAHEGVGLFMPAYLAGSDALGLKALTLFPHNPEQHGLPAIAALVVLFDTTHGQPLALLEGGYLTALRTGAASGLATRLMARDDARALSTRGQSSTCGASLRPSRQGEATSQQHAGELSLAGRPLSRRRGLLDVASHGSLVGTVAQSRNGALVPTPRRAGSHVLPRVLPWLGGRADV